MTPRRLRAAGNGWRAAGGPDAATVPAMVAGNALRLGAWNHDFQGKSATRLREQVRREVTGLAAEFLKRHGLAGAESPRLTWRARRPRAR